MQRPPRDKTCASHDEIPETAGGTSCNARPTSRAKPTAHIGDGIKRFVVLLHRTDSGDHWDLMLEAEDTLWTWALPILSLPLESFRCLVRRLPDHRSEYLEYEGPVSRRRGTVERIDEGTCRILSENRFELLGRLFHGTVTFAGTTEDREQLTLVFEKKP